MAGRPKTRARREALARRARGEPPQFGDDLLLAEADAAEAKRLATLEERKEQQADLGETDADERMLRAWWATIPPDVQALLMQEVEEPEGATFSHKTVQRMAQSGNTDRDIAILMRIDRKRLVTEAREALELGRAIYRVMLTHGQTKSALSGDKAVQIWLGKQKLGQVDRVVSDHNVMLTEVQEQARKVREKFAQRLGLDPKNEIGAGVAAMLSLPRPTPAHESADAADA